MRPSNRDKMLTAALAVVERGGVAALTFEAVAEESGISRGGLLYHFATKEDLVLGLHEFLAARWELQLTDALGSDPASATSAERLAAYTKVSIQSADSADLLLMIEATRHPQLKEVWRRVAARWVPDFSHTTADDEEGLAQLVALLAADGLWVSESVGLFTVPTALRADLASRFASILGVTGHPPHVSDT